MPNFDDKINTGENIQEILGKIFEQKDEWPSILKKLKSQEIVNNKNQFIISIEKLKQVIPESFGNSDKTPKSSSEDDLVISFYQPSSHLILIFCSSIILKRRPKFQEYQEYQGEINIIVRAIKKPIF